MKKHRFNRLPEIWLIVERDRLPDPGAAIASLPRGAGVILRDYDRPDRAAFARTLAAMCRKNALVFLVGKDPKLAWSVGADGVHWPEKLARKLSWGLSSMAAHGPAALVTARRIRADMVLVSPVFPTRSHPGARHLGPGRFAHLARQSPCPAYAMGGVNRKNVKRLKGPSGWAGIEGLAEIPACHPGEGPDPDHWFALRRPPE